MDDNNNNSSISNEERQRQEIKNLLSKQPSSSPSPVKVNTNTNNTNIANKANNSNTTTTTTSNNTLTTTTTTNNNNNSNNIKNITKVPTTTTTNNNTNTNTTQPQTPLREDKLKLAVSFLTSPKVQTADKTKKTAFLKQKGLTDQEIEEAFRRADGQTGSSTQNVNKLPTSNQNTIQQQQSSSYPSSTTSNLAPIVPSRPPVTRPTQVIYYSAADPERLSIKKMIGLALFFGIGAVGITSSLLGVVKKCISPIFKSIYQYQSNRYNDRQHKIERLNDLLKKQWNGSDNHSVIDDNDDDILEKDNNGWWSPILLEQKDLLERLDKVIKYSQKYIDQDDEPYGKFKNVLMDFKDVITKPEYNYTSYTPYSVYGSAFNNRSNTGFDDEAVQGIKSEVRSLKGTLLSRRNFPKAQIKPSAFSSSSTNTTPSTTPPPPPSSSSSSTTTTDKLLDTNSTTTTTDNNNNNNDDEEINKKNDDDPLNTAKETLSSPTSSTSSQAYHPRQREPQSFRTELRNKALEASTVESSSSSSSSSTTITTEQISTIDKGKGKSSVTVEEVKESNDN